MTGVEKTANAARRAVGDGRPDLNKIVLIAHTESLAELASALARADLPILILGRQWRIQSMTTSSLVGVRQTKIELSELVEVQRPKKRKTRK